MKSFSIKGFAWQIPYLLKEIEILQEYMKEPSIETQVEILEENEVISQEQADKMLRERGDIEELERDNFLDR